MYASGVALARSGTWQALCLVDTCDAVSFFVSILDNVWRACLSHIIVLTVLNVWQG